MATATALERILDHRPTIMRIRDTWLLEDIHSVDDPTDWAISPELTPLLGRREPLEEKESGFRSLLDDPDACSEWAV